MTPFAVPLADQYLGDAGDFLLVNRFARRTPWLHSTMTFIAGYGLIVFAALLVTGWWLARRRADPRAMAAALWAGVGTLVAVGVNQPIVAAVHERRPYTSIPHIVVLVTRTTDFGFPSDHATMAGAVAMGLCLVDRRLGIAGWVAALVLAFARVYVAAHYPHDVVAGLAVGALVVGLGYVLVRGPLAWLVRRLERTRIRPVLSAAPVQPPVPSAVGT